MQPDDASQQALHGGTQLGVPVFGLIVDPRADVYKYDEHADCTYTFCRQSDKASGQYMPRMRACMYTTGIIRRI